VDSVVMAVTPDDLLALYERTVDDVYRYASRLTGGHRHRTDDLVQDTYLAVMRRVRSGDPIELTAAYLIVACRSRFLDDLKAEQRRAARQLRAAAGVPNTHDAPPITAITTEVLAEIPTHQRVALILRYVDDLPVREVARHLDRSVRATESLLARGRAALRDLLDDEGGRHV
jgi:RNA polymerase sigma-70 factor (ECF subfamily)